MRLINEARTRLALMARSWGQNLLRTHLARQVAWLMAVAAGWEALARASVYPPILFPRLSDVLATLVTEMRTGEILARTGWSLGTICTGVALAVAISIAAAGIALGIRPLRPLVDALLNVLHPLPGIAVLPIFLLWFGTGAPAVLAVVVFSCIWPMVQNLLAGLEAVPRTQIEVGRNLGLRRARLILFVLIPASLPYALAGLRLAWARGWQTAVAGEMVFGAGGGDGGLGWFIYKRRFFLEIPAVFAGMLMIIIIGILVEHVVFGTLERLTVRRWGMSRAE
ncbi:MAG: ABC transporter permease subunit [Limnochordales bacterium]|nr:ABC transporter permease subunit [Limnochordales bacterium]